MFWNIFTGAVIGIMVGGIAFMLTGRRHVHDDDGRAAAVVDRDDSR